MHISEATVADAHYLKSRLRASDRAELKATGRTPEETVPLAQAVSAACYTVRAEEGGKPLAMYGVAPTPELEYVGTVWMLCTAGVYKVSKSFLKEVPRILAGFMLLYPEGLHNVALLRKDNDVNLRWIKACGFTFKDVVARNGHPFIYFIKEA